MPRRITYLLGAGASAEALPVTETLAKRLGKLIDNLTTSNKYVDEGLDQEKVAKLVNDLKWLLSGASSHASVDTFAKKVYLRDGAASAEYRRVRIALTCFFLLEQARPKGLDKRYDVFFAALLAKSSSLQRPVLPNQIRVLSWNYDSQFEKSYAQFRGGEVTKDVIRELQSAPFNGLEPGDDRFIDMMEFSILRLNGIAGRRHEQPGQTDIRNPSLQVLTSRFPGPALGLVLEVYEKYQQEELDLGIRFAWETAELADSVQRVAARTEILIVIGYSFPAYNRFVDRRVMQRMRKSVREVYVQCGKQSKVVAETIKDFFPNRVDHVHLVESTEQFYIPLEYFPEGDPMERRVQSLMRINESAGESKRTKDLLQKIMNESVEPLFWDIVSAAAWAESLFEDVTISVGASDGMSNVNAAVHEFRFDQWKQGLPDDHQSGNPYVNLFLNHNALKVSRDAPNHNLTVGVNFERYRYTVALSDGMETLQIKKFYTQLLEPEDVLAIKEGIMESIVRFAEDNAGDEMGTIQ